MAKTACNKNNDAAVDLAVNENIAVNTTLVEKLREKLEDIREVLFTQEEEIQRLHDGAIGYGWVIENSQSYTNPDVFEIGDDVRILAKNNNHGRLGKIKSLDIENGQAEIKFADSDEVAKLNLGFKDQGEKEIQLLYKNDGTNVKVSVNGRVIEVYSRPGIAASRGQLARLHLCKNTLMSVENADALDGDMAHVVEKLNARQCIVECGQHRRLVQNELEVAVGDKVVVDSTKSIILKVIPNEEAAAFKINHDLNVTWDDVGGCEQAKQVLVETIEWPAAHPSIFKFYNQTPTKGILLYGPPGCGKTMLGKAAATSLARAHGQTAKSSGFIYIKGPELLSKWVGESEAESRNLFTAARRHHEKYGYPAIIFVDEADSVFFNRGGCSDNQKYLETLVSTWLSELDGLDTNTCLTILATNRPKALDGAITREGRIDRRCKVERPRPNDAKVILKLHLRNTPLYEITENELVDKIVANLRQERPIAKFPQDLMFGFSDCVSGALLAGLVQQAKSKAIRRDISLGKQQGVMLEDFNESIDECFQQHLDLNHEFDILDFMDTHGIKEGTRYNLIKK